ncbi:manganese efflux pump MntP family protein [Adlercreutzia sp. ZJ138]|uniref:manganese efflux pump MntP n=1 Tax=Adlercreutzia sp. ZJ138 TaxID=2709405 RepID=UPI0013EACE95|nr:manganese efflux pump MntP family protein [Adlercreutzia sp. ZJ138]
MGFVELFLIAIGLSMDAFAVSVCKGLCMKRVNWAHALVIAVFFGGFQGLMPVIGWALGTQFATLITPVDHWIAFGLLAFIGGKMLWDAFHEDEEALECPAEQRLDLRELVMLAIATSIDALAVGITFAFLGVNIVAAAALIGVTTFALSFVGVAIGNQFGARFEKPATIAGGVVLILIGVKILLEHLGVLTL